MRFSRTQPHHNTNSTATSSTCFFFPLPSSFRPYSLCHCVILVRNESFRSRIIAEHERMTSRPPGQETQAKSVLTSTNGSKRPASANVSRWFTQNRNVLLGQLPDDFLRVRSEDEEQIVSDARTAMAMQQQQNVPTFRTILSPTVPMPPVIGRLDILVLEAKLVKNYGLTRMDPYVRIRFGMHQVYESHTAVNGGKNPRWNKMFHCFLPEGQDNFHLQIMDERTFSDDEEIAFVHYEIPDDVLNGRTKEEWLDLQGRSGKEGVIGIVLKFTALAAVGAGVVRRVVPQQATIVPLTPIGRPVVPITNANLGPVHVDRSQNPPLPPVAIPDQDVSQLRDMFPSIDVDVIRTLLENERGNRDVVVNLLLQMSE